MSFWRQLRFLLWKNFLIRIRQRVWMVLELCWPLCMFLILMWVRGGANVTEKHPECHYSAKALPSAGVLPFVQSYLCTIKNTCHRTAIGDGDGDIGRVNLANYSLLAKVSPFMEIFLSRPDSVRKISAAVNDVTRNTRNVILLSSAVRNLMSVLSTELGGLTSAGRLTDLFSSFTGNDPNATTDISSRLLGMLTCGEIKPDSGRMFSEPSAEQRMRERFRPEATASPIKPGPDDEYSQFESGENTTVLTICEHFQVEPRLEEKCMDFLAGIGRVPAGLIGPMFTMVRGYILVSPDNPATRRIVGQMEEWMQGISLLKESLIDFHLNAEAYQDALANSTLRDMYSVLCGIPIVSQQLCSALRGFVVNSSSPDAVLPRLKNVTEMVTAMFECFLVDRFRLAATEHEMESQAMCLSDVNKFFAGLYFNVTSNASSLPPITTYKIRMPMALVGGNGLTDSSWNPRPRDNPFIDMKYMYYGFSFIQDSVDRAIVRQQTNDTQKAGAYLQQFPAPCYQQNAFARAIERMLPLLMVIAWVCSASLIVKNVVYEKEQRLKEFMKVMGLGDLVHWVAWFLQSFLFILVSVLLFVIVVKYGRVVEATDVSVLFVFVLLFLVATITQCFLISTFFGEANIAAACGAVIYFLLYVPYWIVVQFGTSTSYSSKLASCLSAQVAFGWGCNYIAVWESTGVGVTWANVNGAGSWNRLTMADCMWMMAVDTIIHVLLTWYIEAVFPGQYGIARPFYFCLTRSYWCGTKPRKEELPLDQLTVDRKVMESEPTQLPLGVAVRNLKKVYSNGKVALSGVSINFYESQITSFLGHNGAGKTTTLSILTGLFPPTEGTVLVYGNDVRTEIHNIRKSLGMCPQHNILFGALTVRQQLKFYGGLKGVALDELDKKVEEAIEELGLTDKADTVAQNLSGGTQRRLAVAVAFIGGSTTVILDEPTAGVDPCARRLIWDSLLRKKQGRTIILSTHFMDEADVLGDRIAIIGAGRLKCCGSGVFLKKVFGSGYRLSVVRKQASNCTSSTESVEPAVTAFISSNLPGAALTEDIGHEFSYTIPSTNPQQLFEFFVQLESRLDEFDLSSYGVSDARLEEIFLKAVGEEGEEERSPSALAACCLRLRRRLAWSGKGKRKQQPLDDTNPPDSSGDEACDDRSRLTALEPDQELYERSTAVRIIARQLRALLTKRYLNFKRNLKGAFCEIVAPIVLIAVVLYLLDFQPPRPRGNSGALLIVPWQYRPPIYVFHSMDDPTGLSDTWAQSYLSALNEPPGLGIRCAKNQPFEDWMPCGNDSSWSATTPMVSTTPAVPVGRNQCRCDENSIYVCPAGAYQPPPHFWLTNTTDIMVNLTHHNISQWLLMTEKEYRKKRYGGYSLGERSVGAVENVSWPLFYQNMEELSEALGNLSNALGIHWNQRRRAPQSPLDLVNASFVTPLSPVERLRVLLSGLDLPSNVKIWFNNQGWIAGPAYANLLSNAVLRRHLAAEEDETEYGIVIINHPMNFSKTAQAERMAEYSLGRLSFEASMVILAFCVVPASFVLFVIEENIVFSKHLQLVSGVRPVLYWVSNYLWDMMNFMIPAVGTMLLFFIFDEKAYIGWARTVVGTFCLLFFYGLAIIPMMYPFTFLFRIPSLAFVTLTMGNAFIGWVATLTTLTLELLSDLDPHLTEVNDVLMRVFLIFPQYCLGRGLLDLKVAYFFYIKESFLYGNTASPVDPFTWYVLGRNLLALFLSGCFWFTLVLLIEYWPNLTGRLHTWSQPTSGKTEDEDVKWERERLGRDHHQSYALKLTNLTKVFGKGSCGRGTALRAVDGLYVGVKAGECFGLLGVNGAGKTTTFSMLTGKLSVSSGDALVKGRSILCQMAQVRTQLGYCPQFDALHALLTGREELRFYARLRGIKGELIEPVVTRVIQQLGLKAYADRRAGTYSGGNKRKLSTAIALMGKPALVLLDEPTTGMDPKARRFLWNRIGEILRDGVTSVVLTSHSMEECEVLCHRIGIMVNGRFQCLGSAQHLKSRFGQGYTLMIKTGGMAENTERALLFVQQRFPGVRMKERHLNQLRLQLPASTRSLSDVFKCLVDAMKLIPIEDYSLTQTTLEDVFLNFAQEQKSSGV